MQHSLTKVIIKLVVIILKVVTNNLIITQLELETRYWSNENFHSMLWATSFTKKLVILWEIKCTNNMTHLVIDRKSPHSLNVSVHWQAQSNYTMSSYENTKLIKKTNWIALMDIRIPIYIIYCCQEPKVAWLW